MIVHKYPVVHKTAQKNLVILFQSLLPFINNVLYQVSYSFIITGRNKSWTGHAEDTHVKFYEENLKVRDITWKTDMKSYASHTRYELDSAGLGQGP